MRSSSLWSAPAEFLPPEQVVLRTILRESFISNDGDTTFIQVTLSDEWNRPEALDAVRDLRDTSVGIQPQKVP